jgi:type VI secretion system protein ImpJ
MFLRPHQLQAAQRYDAYQRGRGDKWDLHYNWGLRSLVLNRDALANHRLVIESLQARLRDGTLVSLPEDSSPPELDLKGPLEGERALKVFLALPVVRLGRPNVAEPGQAEGGRYLLDTLEIEDENTGLNPQPLQMRRLNVKLLLSNQEEHPGYEVLPIARIEKSPEEETLPRVDISYIPPVLACDAWAPLRTDILRYLYDRIGVKIDLLAGQAMTRGIGVESHAAEDTLIIGQLRALNEAYVVLDVLAFADGIHPLAVYTELCRLVGQLAIFGEDRRPPKLPRYDHDDLGTCFWQIKIKIDELLNKIKEPDWVRRPFHWVAPRMEVELKPEWLEPAWQMFVGVKTSLPVEQCITLLTTPGQLDMKIGSAARVDDIYRRGEAGLRFNHRPPPRSLPVGQGLVYFQVDRDAQPNEWLSVKSSGNVAIRLNERRIASSIPGQDTLTIVQGGSNAPLSFALYLVRSASAPAKP